MKSDYPEKILTGILESMDKNIGYSRYDILSTIRDCFTLTRLQGEINALSQSAAHNESSRIEMNKKYDEVEKIISKYRYLIESKKIDNTNNN